MKRYFLIPIIILYWIFGAWYWTCKVKGLCERKTEVVQPAVEKKIENPLVITAQGLNLRSNENLKFNTGGINPEVPSAVDNKFGELKAYLDRNPNKEVTVTGLYTNADPKPATFANLGLGRASKVKEVLVRKGIRADKIVTKAEAKNNLIVDADKVIGGANFTISNKAVAAKPKPVAQPAKPAIATPAATKPAAAVKEAPLVITGGGVNLRSDQNLKFPVGKSKPEIPAKVNQTFNQLSQFLRKNKDKQVTVTGLYERKDPKPVNKKFANLGLERADQIKAVLTKRGIKADQIATKALVRNTLQVIDKKVIGGATYIVSNKPKTKPVVADNKPVADNKNKGVQEKALDFSKATADSFKKGQRIELKNVQFDSGSANLKNTSFADLNKLVNILNKNKTIKIEVGGHTDSVGDLALNNRLSKQRAESVATYLTGKGIVKNRLTSKGYGPSKPVAANTSIAGRQANRRVEVTVN